MADVHQTWNDLGTERPSRLPGHGLTHFLRLDPTLVTTPLTLSDLRDDRTSVEPGSFGASKAMHSSRPSLSDANESWRDSNSHRSSRSYDEMREPENPNRAG